MEKGLLNFLNMRNDVARYIFKYIFFNDVW